MARKLDEFSDALEDRIGAALDREDWAEAEVLSAQLDDEYGNAGITAMVAAMLDQVEVLVKADQAAMANEVRAALTRRDAGEARRLLARKRERHGAIHDCHINAMAELMNSVMALWGEPGLERMLRGVGEAARATMFDTLAALPIEAQVGAWAKSLRNHLGKIEVCEDDEKFTIRQDPCGSGGRLMRAGRFDGEDALARVSGRGLTLGVEGLPVYCAHCPVWLANQANEWYGAPMWALEPPTDNGHPCLIHLYKDPNKVPLEFRARLAPPTIDG